MRLEAERSKHQRLGALAGLLTALALSGIAILSSSDVAAQQQAGRGEDDEVVANLAAGRAVILVGKDGIVIATLEAHAEAETRPPLIVPLSSHRVVVLLGAAEWQSPGDGLPPVRLDAELRRAASPHYGFERKQATETTDIEAIGLAFLEPLRAAAARLHRKIAWPADELLAELLLVQYVEDYGPEVWSIRYTLAQDAMRGEFYNSRVPRPHYLQLYPPDKGQPHTLVESFYPRTGTPLPLLDDLLKGNDPRLARLRSADAQLAHAAERLGHGEAQKLSVVEGLQFVRAALNSVAVPDARQMIVVINEVKGLEWVAGEEEASSEPINEKPREPGAPTLRKKP